MTLFDLHVAGGLPAWDAAALQGPTHVLSVVATAVGLAMGAWLLLRNRNRLGYLLLASSAVLNPATLLLFRTAVEAARVFESGSKNCGTFPAGAR